MSYFNIVCDSCGRGVQGITWVNGMKFCAKCYQETFGASKDWKLLDKDKTIAEQQQRIADLEEQLKNAIVPKFKIGQKVYKVYTSNQTYPFEFKIIGFKITKSRGEDNIFYNVEEDGFDMGWYPDEILFATKEEAQAKLQELKGENDEI